MATQDAIAKVRERALHSLKITGPQIAALYGIEPPQLDFSFRDKSYQQAHELDALATFSVRLLDALETRPEPIMQEGSSNASTQAARKRPRS